MPFLERASAVLGIHSGFMMKQRIFERLISIHLVEGRGEEWDDSSHYHWRWTYPTIEPDTRSFIEKRLQSKLAHLESTSSDFVFFNNQSKWIYIYTSSFANSRFAFVLLTVDFYPTVYKDFLIAFVQLYQQQTSPKRLLHYYLTMMIDEQVSIGELDNRRYTLTPEAAESSPIKSIIRLFHLDVILIYTALLLKRRIAVYHHNQSTLFDFMCSLPMFVPHRVECPHRVLVPNIDLGCSDQISDLKARTHYIATFSDSKIEEREDLYDIYINLAAIEITISHNSRETFSMTKTHKDVAMALVRVAESDTTTEDDVIGEIRRKTTELRNQFYTLANDDCGVVSKQKLKQKVNSPNLEAFYWNFALADGIAEECDDD